MGGAHNVAYVEDYYSSERKRKNRIYLLTCVCCWLIKVHKMSEKMAWLLFVAIGLLLLSTLYTLMFGGEALLLLATDTSHYVCARPLAYYLFNNKSVGIISLDALETDIHFFLYAHRRTNVCSTRPDQERPPTANYTLK